MKNLIFKELKKDAMAQEMVERLNHLGCSAVWTVKDAHGPTLQVTLVAIFEGHPITNWTVKINEKDELSAATALIRPLFDSWARDYTLMEGKT
jgi:hypothetical protein